LIRSPQIQLAQLGYNKLMFDPPERYDAHLHELLSAATLAKNKRAAEQSHPLDGFSTFRLAD
jgi:hypothetical protein